MPLFLRTHSSFGLELDKRSKALPKSMNDTHTQNRKMEERGECQKGVSKCKQPKRNNATVL